MKKLLPLLFLLKVTFAFGQDFKESLRLEDMHEFLPEGYVVLDTATGYLNKDAFIDLIILYKKIDEEEISDVTNNPEKRPLVLYVGDGSGAFKRIAQNENVAYCFDCGGMMGDPYQGISIKNGYFTVEHYGGSGWR